MKSYNEFIKQECDRGRFITYQEGYLKNEPEIVKYLKSLLGARFDKNSQRDMLDVAGGVGYVSYFVQKEFGSWNCHSTDYEESLVASGKELVQNEKIIFFQKDLYKLSEPCTSLRKDYDVITLWMTLFVLDDPQEVINQLTSRLKPGGRIFISSLFHDYDTDISADITDYTLGGDVKKMTYKTYSMKRFEQFNLPNNLKAHWHPFKIGIDLARNGDGAVTHTESLASGERMQVSGGFLMNWHILELERTS